MENVRFVIEKKPMSLSNNTIWAEALGSFFKFLEKTSAEAGEKLGTIVL